MKNPEASKKANIPRLFKTNNLQVHAPPEAPEKRAQDKVTRNIRGPQDCGGRIHDLNLSFTLVL